MKKIIMSLVIAVVMLMSPVFAGNSNQSGQSGQSSQVGQSHHGKKGCFFKKIKKHAKKSYKKAKKSYKKAKKCAKKSAHKGYDAAQNKVMDAGVSAKKKITCKKNKTWVKGYYTKKGKHIKGHWRKVGKDKR